METVATMPANPALTPQQALPAVCAYCDATISGDPRATARVSHGICRECFEAEMAKVRARKETVTC